MNEERREFNDYRVPRILPPMQQQQQRYRPYNLEPQSFADPRVRSQDRPHSHKHRKPVKPIKPLVDPPTSSRIAYGPWKFASGDTGGNHGVNSECGPFAQVLPKSTIPVKPDGLPLPFSEPAPVLPPEGEKDFSNNHDIDSKGGVEFSGVLSKSLEYKEMCRGRGLYCHWCDLGMPNIEAYQQHLLGQRHMKMLKKEGLEDEIGTPSQARANTGLIGGNEGLKIMFCIVCKEECYSNKLGPHVTRSKHLAAENNWKRMNKRLPRFIDMFVEKGMVPVAPTSMNKLHCKVCNITLSSFEELEIHNAGKKHCRALAALSDDEPKSFHCKLCDVHCTSEAGLQNHLSGKKHAMMKDQGKSTNTSNDHDTTPTYSCDICNITCTSVEQLKDHFMKPEHFLNVSTNSGGMGNTGLAHSQPMRTQPGIQSPQAPPSGGYGAAMIPSGYNYYNNPPAMPSTYQYNASTSSWQYYRS